jgi:hypothetical protein
VAIRSLSGNCYVVTMSDVMENLFFLMRFVIIILSCLRGKILICLLLWVNDLSFPKTKTINKPSSSSYFRLMMITHTEGNFTLHLDFIVVVMWAIFLLLIVSSSHVN